MHSLRDLVLFIFYTEYPTRCSILGHVRCPIIVCWMYAQVLEIKLLLLLLSHFSRVRLCATPLTAAHKAPLSLGFSRQEYWSGVPLPSPMQESEKWKWSRSVVSDSSRPHGLHPTRLLSPWDFPDKNTGVGYHFLLQRNKATWIQIGKSSSSYALSVLNLTVNQDHLGRFFKSTDF